ncbi:MAG: hypothetical protein K6D96_05885 [Acetatifactor sp.]|nr:hypothetical protein [Acetatifactor sp.]
MTPGFFKAQASGDMAFVKRGKKKRKNTRNNIKKKDPARSLKTPKIYVVLELIKS